MNGHFSKEDTLSGQQEHEKMLQIINHQRNANQNHSEVSPCICQNGYHQKEWLSSNVRDNMEKGKPLYTVGGNVNCASLWKVAWRFLKN